MLKRVLKLVGYSAAIVLAFVAGNVFAADMSLGGVASQITQSFGNVTQLITAGSYIAGVGFGVGAILKFKQHKDNPTQVPIGTPISMVFIAGCLLFFPTVLGVTGQTIFGSGASTASPTGTIFEAAGGS